LPVIPGGAGALIKAYRAGNMGADALRAGRIGQVALGLERGANLIQTADIAFNTWQGYEAYQRGDYLSAALAGMHVPIRALQGGLAARRFLRNYQGDGPMLAVPFTRNRLSVVSRVARSALEPLVERVGHMTSLPYRQRLTLGARLQRLFVTATARHPALGSSPIGGMLQRIPLVRRLHWEHGHTFIQRRWFRAGTPTQWYPTNAAANLGLRRLGNAGWNLTPMPRAMNRYLGSHPWFSAGYGGVILAGGGSAIAGAWYGAWELGEYLGTEIGDLIYGGD
jgi:hypothetical protein